MILKDKEVTVGAFKIEMSQFFIVMFGGQSGLKSHI